ncbi:Transposase DDE domain protein [Jannaschia seosinensis]|uniref:Transposase DDE domain protein n=1 Tax=Jannaschia seosinensis TaxID=313367 RepID=A0A0M7BA28_9RHOB|nr:Transposase DDE domain protein [Jannaschia seosinensis]
MGRDTRYVVTNLEGGRGKHLYEKLYSARGQAENHIKAWKTHLASDRTSCSKANANQMRLMLHGCAYWVWWKLRAACPKRSPWRRAQFDTLRLHLVKLAATIVEKKTRIIVTLPASCPERDFSSFSSTPSPHRKQPDASAPTNPETSTRIAQDPSHRPACQPDANTGCAQENRDRGNHPTEHKSAAS